MAVLIGKLSEVMPKLADLGVLIVDEATITSEGRRVHQISILNVAVALKCPVWVIEINHKLDPTNRVKTDARLTTAVNDKFTLVLKRSLNAFAKGAVPDLKDELVNAGVKRLVIMGQQANQCVKLTAVGGFPKLAKFGGKHEQGATGLGFEVYSCDLILNDKANWKNEQNVTFYTEV
jgi:hypothetical protein